MREGHTVTTLVHGISGVRRTGAYVITSMLCKQVSLVHIARAPRIIQIRDQAQVSLLPACLTVRRYRYGVMRNRLMFTTVLDAILNFAAESGQLDRKHQDFARAIKKIRQFAVEPTIDEDDCDE